ncbi:MAG: hypothetical protein ACD_10C00783G0001 [uncultured bacterium]|nr:MAG: hypothetical protein ACD_10C00783G0001 [uncultured bacterium]
MRGGLFGGDKDQRCDAWIAGGGENMKIAAVNLAASGKNKIPGLAVLDERRVGKSKKTRGAGLHVNFFGIAAPALQSLPGVGRGEGLQ